MKASIAVTRMIQNESAFRITREDGKILSLASDKYDNDCVEFHLDADGFPQHPYDNHGSVTDAHDFLSILTNFLNGK